MANEVIYAEVPSEERMRFTSQNSDAGDQITYAEVKVKRKSDNTNSTSKSTHTTVDCHETKHWCYIAIILYFVAVILLICVILLAVKCNNP